VTSTPAATTPTEASVATTATTSDATSAVTATTPTTHDDDGFVVLGVPVSASPVKITLSLKCSWHESHSLIALYFDAPTSEVKPGDWIGLFHADATSREYLTYWKTGGAMQGWVTHVATRSQFGQLEMRWLRADYTEVARSNVVRHGPRVRLAARCEGDKVLVSWRSMPQLCDERLPDGTTRDQVATEQKQLWTSTSDWCGLFAVADARLADTSTDLDEGVCVNEQPVDNRRYLAALYLGSDDVVCFDRPKKAGVYEVRFFSAHARYHCLSRTRVVVP